MASQVVEEVVDHQAWDHIAHILTCTHRRKKDLMRGQHEQAII
jgi:hypothetical protein